MAPINSHRNRRLLIVLDTITQHFFSHAHSTIEKNQHQTELLFIVDDGFTLPTEELVTLSQTTQLTVITNRFCTELIRAANTTPTITLFFSDFDFSELSRNTYNAIYYRVSKEKPVVHHILNHAYLYLKNNGSLLMAGKKNEGSKTYFDKCGKTLGLKIISKKTGDLYFADVTRPAPDYIATQKLDDSQYHTVREVAEQKGATIKSKPGVYGWKKFDVATKALIELLNERFPTLKNHTVLDLGCGSGYLSLAALQLDCKHVTATDNNAAAVHVTRLNIEEAGYSTERHHVEATDCAAGIDQKFDLVLCNPPFHKGFETSKALTDGFLKNTANRLSPTGEALFVVNAFIGLEKIGAAYFKRVETLFSDGRFKIIRLAH